MIEISHLNKIYKSKKRRKCHALKDINLTLPDNGLVFVLGKSGSGKSTLLNLIGGLDNITVTDVSVTAIYSPDIINSIKELFVKQGLTVQKCHAAKGADNTLIIKMTVKSQREFHFDDMVEIFEHNENIISFAF